MNREDIHRNLIKVREEIEEAAFLSKRNPTEIILVAVSKHHPPEFILWASEKGQLDFGENYIQEALEKIEKLRDLNLRFHYIGRCQSNKAKYIPGKFVLVHSVDSIKFATELDKRCLKMGIEQDILIQVNVAEEETKGGVLIKDLYSFVDELMEKTKKLSLKGLMCMPPYFEDPEKVRPYFSKLRKLRDELEGRVNIVLPHLSMGMSSDFKQAILEGATIIRIGTSIFGPRSN